MRRIVELEKEVKKWQGWHSETSQTLSEVCGKAEAAERELENERMMSMKRFVETGRADTFAIQQQIKAIRAAKVKSYDTSRGLVVSVESLEDLINQLRQQLNGDE